MNIELLEKLKKVNLLLQSEALADQLIGLHLLHQLNIIPKEFVDAKDVKYSSIKVNIDIIEDHTFETHLDIGCPCGSNQNEIVNFVSAIQNLVSFKFCCMNIQFPKDFFEIKNLKSLDMPMYGIGTKDSELQLIFKNFTNLEYLNISSNKLNYIPKEIKNLGKLKKLDLSSNPITTLPSDLGEIETLEHLDLFMCTSLEEFPNTVLQLKNLKYLRLRGSSVSSIPNEINQLKNLETLHLQKSKIEHIPEGVYELPNLKELKIHPGIPVEEKEKLKNRLGIRAVISEH